MQVQALIDYFDLLATTHLEIQSFGTGDIWEEAIAGEDVYPRLWLEQVFNSQVINQGVNRWSLAFWVHNIQLHDESDENELLDKTYRIGLQVIEKIRQDQLYIIDDNFSAISFTEKTEDFTCGWRFEIVLTEALGIDRCTIDGAFNPICAYTVDIDGSTSGGLLQGIITATGPLSLNPPYSLSFASITAEAARLEADLIALGYNATVSAIIIIGFPVVTTLTITITNTSDIFLCADGISQNFMFTALCDCEQSLEYYGFTDGENLTSFNLLEGGTLPLITLPLDCDLSNASFDTDLKLLEDELIDLGYTAELTNITGPADKDQRFTILISNGPVLSSVSGDIRDVDFLNNCS